MAIFGLNPHGFTWNYYLVHILCRFTLYIFFRKVHLINTENIPVVLLDKMEGGLVICGTHNNQFVDAMVIIPDPVAHGVFSSRNQLLGGSSQH